MILTFDPTSTEYHWSWATLSGPDARDFLHRVTTVNLHALDLGGGANGCLLNAQGKIRAPFKLWNYGPDDFGFEYDSGRSEHWKKSFFESIDQFTFAEKMTLTDVTALGSRWIFASRESDQELLRTLGVSIEPMKTIAIDDEIRICHQGSRDFGRTWITAWGRPERLAQWFDQKFGGSSVASKEALTEWRVTSMRPWADHELTENTTPLETGFIDAIAPNKGCYPGQEIIEKVISLGSPPRRLALISGSGPAPAQGSKIVAGENAASELGEITSSVSVGGNFKALGLIRKTHAKEGTALRFENSEVSGVIERIAPYADSQ